MIPLIANAAVDWTDSNMLVRDSFNSHGWIADTL